MLVPNPGIDQLLRSAQFKGPNAPPAAARPPAAASAPPMAAFGRQAAPQAAPSPAGAPPPNLAALLANILQAPQGAPPVAAPAPRQPTRSPEAEKLISAALADPEADSKPLFLAADRLDELGINADDLGVSLAHLGLHAAPDWDAQGGFLIARSPDVLERADELKAKGQPVPIISMRSPPPPKARAARAPARPSGAGVPGAKEVRPLAPALEEARRDRARQHVREARSARNFENYGAGRLEWRRSGGPAQSD
jgi:hypothetical protein